VEASLLQKAHVAPSSASSVSAARSPCVNILPCRQVFHPARNGEHAIANAFNLPCQKVSTSAVCIGVEAIAERDGIRIGAPAKGFAALP
jgi:hypothetical protein